MLELGMRKDASLHGTMPLSTNCRALGMYLGIYLLETNQENLVGQKGNHDKCGLDTL